MEKKTSKEMPQVGALLRPSFLSEGLRSSKKLDMQRTPLAKSFALLTSMSFFHSCFEVALHQRSLGHSVNPEQ